MSTKHQFPHSSSICEIEHHPDKKELNITFSSGGKHKFHDIDEDTVKGMLDADSAGRYFHLNIKKVFKSSRMD